jgi:hypothetical protein
MTMKSAVFWDPQGRGANYAGKRSMSVGNQLGL